MERGHTLQLMLAYQMLSNYLVILRLAYISLNKCSTFSMTGFQMVF